MSRGIEVGEKYHISWRSGAKHVGEIIEIRPLKRLRDNNTKETYSNGQKIIYNLNNFN